MRFLIGTYTEQMDHVDGHGDGILAVTLNAESGRLEALQVLAAVRNPSYLAVDRSAARVYAVSEMADEDGAGTIAAFSLDAGGTLTWLNTVSSGGPFPAFLTVDEAANLHVANYGGSVASFTLSPAGLEDASNVFHYPTPPSNHVRQDSSHPHHIAILNREMLVCDLGAGSIWVHDLAADGKPVEQPREQILIGSAGPRHLVVHADGRHIAICNELDSTITLMQRQDDGTFIPLSSVTTRDRQGPDNLAAAIIASASNRALFVTNRGDDTVSLFDWTGPTLNLRAVHQLAGKTPRDAALAPDGRHIIVAAQDSDLLECLIYDEAKMSVSPRSEMDIASPACVVAL
ncbi:lactonase family protein [Microbacterium marinum]|uniref:lactonase family protein n=1 Tax=Microbacterium marinum TaxID=421115 RepID=UPI00384B1AC2